MKIQVLGTGCAKCKKLYAEVERAVVASGLPAELEKVEKIDEIMRLGVLITPGVIVDGKIVHSGGVPDRNKIESWL